MFNYIKKLIRKIIVTTMRVFSGSRLGKLVGETLIGDVMQRTKSIVYKGIKLSFTIPNALNHFRIDTFSEKEPETLEWIDSFSQNGLTLWDIGANVGLYSIYAAKSKECKVFSFEPSVFNLELLSRNIFLNDLQNRIAIIPFPLSNKMGLNNMRFTTTEWGGALSTFGEDIGWDGKPIEDIFSFKTFGCTMDQIISVLNLPQPDHIKMDVDGIEHIILEGGNNVLKKTKSILVEINDDFEEQLKQTKFLLKNAGFILGSKLHGEIIENSTSGFSNTYNQIWLRK